MNTPDLIDETPFTAYDTSDENILETLTENPIKASKRRKRCDEAVPKSVQNTNKIKKVTRLPN